MSPDARSVAYSSNLSGQVNLWIQPVGGGSAEQVTHWARHAVRDMAWAPDGKSLVFTADQDGDEQYQIYRVGVDDSEPERLTGAEGRQHALAAAAFDATGRYLVYSVNDRDPAVRDTVVRDLVAGADRRVVPSAGVMFEPVGISPMGGGCSSAAFALTSVLPEVARDAAEAAAALVPRSAAGKPPGTRVLPTSPHERGTGGGGRRKR